MNIHQMSVQYDERQDRLSLRVSNQDNQEFRLWLTRAMTLRLLLIDVLIDVLIAHTASCSEGRMILSKRQESQLVLASLVHNPIEFKDARLFDGVDIDRNDRLGQKLAF